MTSAERVALVRALMRHPGVQERFAPAWRIKRLESGELRKLAREFGVEWLASPAPRKPPPPQEPRPLHEGHFKGALRLPFRVALPGEEGTREVRVHWGYTPVWEHLTADCRRIVTGAPETLSMSCEIKAEGQYGNLWTWEWIPADLLNLDVLPDSVVDQMKGLIDEEARRQNQARLRRTSCGD